MHEIELHDLKDLIIIVYLNDLRLTILALTRSWHATQQCDANAMQQAQESTANFVYLFIYKLPQTRVIDQAKKKKEA